MVIDVYKRWPLICYCLLKVILICLLPRCRLQFSFGFFSGGSVIRTVSSVSDSSIMVVKLVISRFSGISLLSGTKYFGLPANFEPDEKIFFNSLTSSVGLPCGDRALDNWHGVVRSLTTVSPTANPADSSCSTH